MKIPINVQNFSDNNYYYLGSNSRGTIWYYEKIISTISWDNYCNHLINNFNAEKCEFEVRFLEKQNAIAARAWVTNVLWPMIVLVDGEY